MPCWEEGGLWESGTLKLCAVLEVPLGIGADRRPLSQSDIQLEDPSSFLNLLANSGELWILENTSPYLLTIFLSVGGSPHGRNS